MDCLLVEKQIHEFIKERTTGFDGVIIGLSGGIDSALSATLAADALGKDKVHALMLPNGNIISENTLDAIELARHYLEIDFSIINIESIISGFRGAISERKCAWDIIDTGNKLILGNAAARSRMMILYTNAQANNCLVLGTTNKTEEFIGYFTKHGDGAVDIEPIIDLYKCEVRELARFVGVPDFIIDKAPTAELWTGQTDEGELGCTYNQIDEYLMKGTFTGKTREIVEKLHDSTHHKREVPYGCRLTSKE